MIICQGQSEPLLLLDLIIGGKILINVYGCWPSFSDLGFPAGGCHKSIVGS